MRSDWAHSVCLDQRSVPGREELGHGGRGVQEPLRQREGPRLGCGRHRQDLVEEGLQEGVSHRVRVEVYRGHPEQGLCRTRGSVGAGHQEPGHVQGRHSGGPGRHRRLWLELSGRKVHRNRGGWRSCLGARGQQRLLLQVSNVINLSTALCHQ